MYTFLHFGRKFTFIIITYRTAFGIDFRCDFVIYWILQWICTKTPSTIYRNWIKVWFGLWNYLLCTCVIWKYQFWVRLECNVNSISRSLIILWNQFVLWNQSSNTTITLGTIDGTFQWLFPVLRLPFRIFRIQTFTLTRFDVAIITKCQYLTKIDASNTPTTKLTNKLKSSLQVKTLYTIS